MPTVMAVPSATSHSSTVPSSIVRPSFGRRISMATNYLRSRRRRTAASMRGASGTYAFSRIGAYGTGAKGAASRATGASR